MDRAWNAGLPRSSAPSRRAHRRTLSRKETRAMPRSISPISKKKPSGCSNPTTRVARDNAARFDQILMDELQDTNRLQWRLINLIRATASSRSAISINRSTDFVTPNRRCFEEYRRQLLSRRREIDDLRENHRSLPEILRRGFARARRAAGNRAAPSDRRARFIRRSAGRATGRASANREPKTSKRRWSRRASASWSIRRSTSFADIAILVRALSATEPFERALDRFGIPFLVSGGRTFLEAREIRDLLALLAALVNPLDEIALVGVLRSPLSA